MVGEVFGLDEFFNLLMSVFVNVNRFLWVRFGIIRIGKVIKFFVFVFLFLFLRLWLIIVFKIVLICEECFMYICSVWIVDFFIEIWLFLMFDISWGRMKVM